MEVQEQTLEELKKGYFKKIRFCVFPLSYEYNDREPEVYPYEGKPLTDWDFERFNPEYFRLFENRINDLAELGIEADIIVMHPYDHWGFSNMGAENENLYWKYVIARFAAFRNVWWSLANEYECLGKPVDDWERYAEILCEKDPYGRLRSIHNYMEFYDHTKPWVTHCSLQSQSVERTATWRERYGKPVIFDEMIYEGNLNEGWGGLSATELVRRFWECAVLGGYGGHGETYKHPEDIIWWSHGGELHGESPERIKFLLNILYETPGVGLKKYTSGGGDSAIFTGRGTVAVPEEETAAGSYYLIYFGKSNMSSYECELDGSASYEIEVIDTWEMTVEKLGVMSGKLNIELPGKAYMAIRIRKA